jgi:hypothetical protein
MIKSLTNQLGIKGHLTVHKVVDGHEELVYDEDNVIVSGLVGRYPIFTEG